tara:strand:+ start:16695 stop:17537 length:843 start_codon:yes stop_codon:yes gene_type:complete
LKNNKLEILNKKVLKDFGNEWKEFDQSILSLKELKISFNQYFYIFPKKKFNKKSVGFDLGCGSGRWAKFVAPKVKKLNCIDPSKLAIKVAKKNLSEFKNINYYNKRISRKLLINNSQDFGYCLGVLHHTSETKKGIKFCHRILKKNSPFLIYLYYNFDNRNFIYKFIWKISNILRLFISKLPFSIKKKITDFLALIIYLPLAKLSYILNLLGLNTFNLPLSYYKNKSFYTMRNDSLDRFGTRLEKRFSKNEIYYLLKSCGFKDIKFSKKMPFWVAICKKS